MHFRLGLLIDAVAAPDDDDQGRIYVSRLRKARPGAVALRFALRADGTLWLEQLNQDSDGGRWWPVCPVRLLGLTISGV